MNYVTYTELFTLIIMLVDIISVSVAATVVVYKWTHETCHTKRNKRKKHGRNSKKKK